MGHWRTVCRKHDYAALLRFLLLFSSFTTFTTGGEYLLETATSEGYYTGLLPEVLLKIVEFVGTGDDSSQKLREKRVQFMFIHEQRTDKHLWDSTSGFYEIEFKPEDGNSLTVCRKLPCIARFRYSWIHFTMTLFAVQLIHFRSCF